MIGSNNHTTLFNDCKYAPTKVKYFVLVFLTKCFLPTPHQVTLNQQINLNTMITCDWPPSHY